MKAHLFRKKSGRWYFSGHNACGDPFDGAGIAKAKTMKPRPFDAIVDLGDRSFFLTEPEGNLYLNSPGKAAFSEWTPVGLVLAARAGWFGFTIEERQP